MRASETRCVGRYAMYKTFRVKNFRCFKDLQINDLGRVNLIAGKNNTGKTALMEAMYAFTRPLSPQVLFELQQIRTDYVPNEHVSAVWRQFFAGMDTSENIELSGSETLPKKSTHLSIRELSRSEENAEAFLRYFRYLTEHGVPAAQANGFITRAGAMLEFRHVDEDGTDRDTQFLPESPIPVNTEVAQRSLFVPVCAEPDKEITAAQFSNADMRGERPQIEAMLKHFEPKLSELRLQSPYGETTIWAQMNGFQLPLSLMGDGVNHVCHYMLSMMSRPEFLFIDEIENGIHHSVQKDVWTGLGRLAREKSVQVFATTHSAEMIEAAYEAFEDDDLDDFRFHRLYRDSTTGNIEARTYNEYSIGAAIRRNYEVRG